MDFLKQSLKEIQIKLNTIENKITILQQKDCNYLSDILFVFFKILLLVWFIYYFYLFIASKYYKKTHGSI